MIAYYTLAFPEFAVREAERIEALRARLDPVCAARVKAHVTIGFAVESVARARLCALLRRVARKVEPFDVCFDRVALGQDHRDTRGYAFWMPSVGRPEIEALHKHLHADPDLRYPIHRSVPYRPHITLAERPDEASARGLVDELAAERPVARGQITHLSLVALERDQVRPVDHFALGSGDI